MSQTNSKLFSVNLKEFLRGLTVAVTGAIITALYTGIESGITIFDVDWKAVGSVALAAGLAYISQKFVRNSKEELFIRDSK